MSWVDLRSNLTQKLSECECERSNANREIDLSECEHSDPDWINPAYTAL